jgi:hypothetical protein
MLSIEQLDRLFEAQLLVAHWRVDNTQIQLT